jgi:hypothetical protein
LGQDFEKRFFINGLVGRHGTCWDVTIPADHAAKLDEAAVTSALDDAAIMRGGGGIDQIAPQPPKARQGAILVRSASQL